MGFKEDFKKGWKGHAGTPPSDSLLEALSKNKGFKDRSMLKNVLGLTTSAIGSDEPVLWACAGSKSENDKTSLMILAILNNRVILAKHSYLASVPNFEVSEIPFDKVSNVRVKKDKILQGEITIETSGANLSMNSNPEWLEQAKTVLMELIESKKSIPTEVAKEATSISSELQKLAELLKDGILTQEEFEAAKLKLLS
jgi:hypothetical protein